MTQRIRESSRTLRAAAPSVNPELARYHEVLGALTGLHAVGRKTHTAIGFGGNINFIEGDDGVVVINTGTTLALSQQALDLYRERCSKPIRAVVYTHGYADHTGGARAFVPRGDESQVDIYASAAWRGYADQAASPIQPEVQLRAAAQVGWLLPAGSAGTVGNALTCPIRGAGGTSYIAPTVEVSKPTRYTMAGVELELLPAPHDLDDGLIVWMPDERILFGGDVLLLNDLYPTLATPRFEARRDPQKWIDSMGLAASHGAEVIINAYGPPVVGAHEVRARLLDQQRIAQFMLDDVHRRILRGEDADSIAADFRLPASVTHGRSYKEHYHRLSWIVRSLVAREFGHVSGDVLDLVRWPPHDRAARLEHEFASTGSMFERAERAYERKDYRWSAELATTLLKLEPTNSDAAKVRHESLRALAYASNSANERNYLLSAVALETGSVDRTKLLRQMQGAAVSDIALRKPPEQMLQVMGHKLRLDEQRPTFSVCFVISDRAAVLHITVLPVVMLRNANPDGSPPDLQFTLTHEALIRGVEGLTSFAALTMSAGVSVAGAPVILQWFLDAFDWWAPR